MTSVPAPAAILPEAPTQKRDPAQGNSALPPEVVIAPSLLAANFRKLEKEVLRASRSGAEWLHLDIMDGHFVPNISFGPAVVKTLRPLSRMFFDVHLMCSRPEILLEPFVSAGANQLNIHVELGEAVTGLLWKIRSLGCRVGLAVNPSTPVSTLRPFLDRVDAVLIMTVNPGFGGQPFIHETLPKIEQVAEWRRQGGLNFRIGVDGGVDFKTASECAHAGADTFISGTTLFASRNLGSAVRKLRKQIQAGLAESGRPGSDGMQSVPITA